MSLEMESGATEMRFIWAIKAALTWLGQWS